MSLEVHQGGAESFKVPWAATEGGAGVDPTSPALTVVYALAAVDAEAPASGWQAGAWIAGGPEIVAIDGRDRDAYWSRTPTISHTDAAGIIKAAAGEWQLWGRLSDSPEILPRKIDRVVIH